MSQPPVPPPWGSPPPSWGTPPAAEWGAPPPSGAGYAGPPGSGAPMRPRTTSGLAVAALVTGLFFWCFVVPGILSVVFGHLALEQIADSGGTKGGRGMAVAGIVLGWVGIGLLAVGVVVWFVDVLLR